MERKRHPFSRVLRIVLTVLLGVPSLFVLYAVAVPDAAFPPTTTVTMEDSTNALELAQDLFLAVRTEEPYDSLLARLDALHPDTLIHQLDSDAKRKAFWLNTYNAFAQIALDRGQVDLTNGSVRLRHYGKRDIRIAGRLLSLDDIEHGMLRHSKVWWSKGYLTKWFPNAFEKALRAELDPRIHFALNCGAASCPAIAYYDAKEIDLQLDLAVQVFLSNEVTFNAQENTISVTPYFNWFAGDFGGKKGTIAFLKKHKLLPQDADPKVVYKDYDWSVRSGNYR